MTRQGRGGGIRVTGDGVDQFPCDLMVALKGLPDCSVLFFSPLVLDQRDVVTNMYDP